MSSPTGPRVYSRADATREIQNQFVSLNVLRGAFAREQEGALKVQLAYRHWWGDTRSLLRRLFDDPSVAERALPLEPAFTPPGLPVDQQFQVVYDEIDRSHDRLGMLLNEIARMPEIEIEPVPGTAQPGPRLEPAQEELLVGLVEASRRVPTERRASFLLVQMQQGAYFIHPGLASWQLRCTAGDVRVLAYTGLVMTAGEDMQQIDVTPAGAAYYEALRTRSGEPLREVESAVLRYLDTEEFRSRHPSSYASWASAATRLWSSDAAAQLTGIGHDIREALQFFTDELVGGTSAAAVNPDPTKTVDRLRAVITGRKSELGTDHAAVLDAQAGLLDALLSYWGAVSDLTQRQEHGALKEGERLTWEDGRRLVFHAAHLMHEVDACLGRSATRPGV